MKKKVLFLFLTLILLFTTACGNTQTEPAATPTPTSTPTPSPTPTPTPTPVNLAETNLKAMSNMTKAAMNSLSDRQIDISQGFGCDMTGTFTLGSAFAEALGANGISSVGFKGTLDFFDVMAMSGSFSLNEASLLDIDFYSDLTKFYCNFPKYSAQYFVLDPAELEGAEFDPDMLAEYSSLLKNQMSNQDALALIALMTTDFAGCFEPEPGIESNVNIGTGNYIITADRHTIRAGADKLRALAEDFIATIDSIPAYAELSAELTASLDPETITDIVLYYYAGPDKSFAWELAPQTEDAGSLVFVSVADGFCLYSDDKNGSVETIFYSETLSENSGKLTIPSELSVDNNIFTYTVGDSSIDVEGTLEDYTIAFRYTLTDSLVDMEFSMSDTSLTLSCKATQEGNHVAASIGIAEDGMELGTFDMEFAYRDYQPATAPTAVTDINTWSESLDMNLIMSDVFLLMSEYPELMTVIQELAASQEEAADVVDFSVMTGYYADAYGNVDFTPTEEDIVAMGLPSTGIDYIEISDAQMSAIVDCISNAFAECYYDSYTYYNVSGNEYDGTVASTYLTQYLYYDAAAPETSILITLEAYTGNLVGLCVDAPSAAEAVVPMNALIAALGIDTTVTVEDLDFGVYAGDFYVYGFEEEGYYEILCIASPEY